MPIQLDLGFDHVLGFLGHRPLPLPLSRLLGGKMDLGLRATGSQLWAFTEQRSEGWMLWSTGLCC